MLPTEKYKNYPVLLLLSLYLALELVILNTFFVLSHFYLLGSFILEAEYRQLSFVSNIIWVALLFFLGDFRYFFKGDKEQTFGRALRFVGFYVSAFALCVLFLVNPPISRDLLACYLVAIVLFIPFLRMVVYQFFIGKSVQGKLKRRAIFLGYDEYSSSLYDEIKENNYYGIECLGFFDNKTLQSQKIGEIQDFYSFDASQYDYIYVSREISKDELVKIISHADQLFKKVKLFPEIQLKNKPASNFHQIEDIVVLEVNELPLDKFFNALVKRIFDITFSLIVFVGIFSWLFPIVAILILIDSRGPVFFKQQRNGNKNHPFACYKFRTMIVNPESDVKWATRDDPRITRVGAFLRRTSMDELPQFINVLMGEMSIVGPRPLPVKLNDEYKDKIEKFLQRHSYKPGITGLAQWKGYRGEIESMQQINGRVRLDRFYLQNWSFLLDIKIILFTMWVLLRGQDKAY